MINPSIIYQNKNKKYREFDTWTSLELGKAHITPGFGLYVNIIFRLSRNMEMFMEPLLYIEPLRMVRGTDRFLVFFSPS